MTAPYSVDLRERVINLKLTGEYTNEEIAELLSISISSVKKYYRQYKNKESLIPKKPGGRKPTIQAEDKALIMTYIADLPDATLKDYRDQLESDTGKSVTIPCMHYVIKELKISYKKNPATHKNKSVRM